MNQKIKIYSSKPEKRDNFFYIYLFIIVFCLSILIGGCIGYYNIDKIIKKERQECFNILHLCGEEYKKTIFYCKNSYNINNIMPNKEFNLSYYQEFFKNDTSN